MTLIAGKSPLDKLKKSNGHDMQYDWHVCPKCGNVQDTILLAAGEPRPLEFCNVHLDLLSFGNARTTQVSEM